MPSATAVFLPQYARYSLWNNVLWIMLQVTNFWKLIFQLFDKQAFFKVIRTGLCPNTPYNPLFTITWIKKKCFRTTTSYLSSNRWNSVQTGALWLWWTQNRAKHIWFSTWEEIFPHPAPLKNVFKKRSDIGFLMPGEKQNMTHNRFKQFNFCLLFLKAYILFKNN